MEDPDMNKKISKLKEYLKQGVDLNVVCRGENTITLMGFGTGCSMEKLSKVERTKPLSLSYTSFDVHRKVIGEDLGSVQDNLEMQATTLHRQKNSLIGSVL